MNIKDLIKPATLSALRDQAAAIAIAAIQDEFMPNIEKMTNEITKRTGLENLGEAMKDAFEEGFKLGAHEGAAEATILFLQELIRGDDHA